MELNWVKLNGFKRFEKATLNTSGKVIALLGPNEAGKSSLLEALTRLNDDNQFQADIQLTRNQDFSDDHIVLEAGFLLSDEDRQAISHLYKSESVQWLYIKKPVSGKRQFELKSLLPIDILYVDRIIERFNKVLSFKTTLVPPKNPLYPNDFDKLYKYINQEDFLSIEQDGQTLIKELKETSTKNNLLSSQIKNNLNNLINLLSKFKNDLEELKSKITTDSQEPDVVIQVTMYKVSNDVLKLRENIDQLTQSINDLLEYDSGTDPNQQAIEILQGRIPNFLLFNQPHRELKSNFNLATLDKTKPTKALENLLKIANINVEELGQIYNNPTKLHSTINKANKTIQEVYEGKWSQSEVRPVLDVNGSVLRVFIDNKDLESFELHQRSDGLRQFIALINFLEVEHAEQPILLVDEAELHLHYDAQADLIEIFSRQKFAAKIIYTTHSVGCLPEDLGTGVKFVCPLENIEERSEVKKHFWLLDKRPGVLPLLFGMGASQLSFIAIRQSVFVEGATDMLLLPTLFRQSLSIEHLGFQIVQGIAMTAKADYGLLENHAPKVAFLVDNDQEGAKYKRELKKAGIEDTRIFQLPKLEKAIVIEDYLQKELYLEAVNHQIQKWNETGGDDYLMSIEDIPNENRPLAVKEWCEKHQLKNPEKISITYYLLDLATGERQENLIEDKVQESFIQLYQDISDILKVEKVMRY